MAGGALRNKDSLADFCPMTSGRTHSNRHLLRICTASEMRKLDESSENDFGIDATLLMENAGRSATQILLEKFPKAGRETEVLVFAGKGNNAGDAFVVARRLLGLDRRVRVFHLAHPSAYRGATLKNFEILRKLKAKMVFLEQSGDLQQFFDSSPGPFTFVDGILGTGLRGDLDGVYYEVVEMINSLHSNQVLSLDIPSGVSGDTGLIHGTSVLASVTVSFGFPKMGHFLPPGAGRRGDLLNVDISLPGRFRKEGDKFVVMRSQMCDLLHERDRYGHKNSFGHTLLIGGSPGRVGAIVMAARACHRMGTGLVTVASWKDCFETLQHKLPPETMATAFDLEGPELETYRKTLPSYTSVVVGPGLGLRPEGKKLLTDLFQNYSGPMVLDADALNLISEFRLHDLLVKRQGQTVLTPHMGEMARLLGAGKEKIASDPVAALKEVVAATHSVVLLKGAATLITGPDDVLYLNHYPNDGMATAGSGDVLAGMIGGLLGQRMKAFDATLLGVYLHSVAGEFAAKALGHRAMTAPDIVENISHAFREIATEQEAGLTEARTRLL